LDYLVMLVKVPFKVPLPDGGACPARTPEGRKKLKQKAPPGE
jgi:hypothetical protein